MTHAHICLIPRCTRRTRNRACRRRLSGENSIECIARITASASEKGRLKVYNFVNRIRFQSRTLLCRLKLVSPPKKMFKTRGPLGANVLVVEWENARTERIDLSTELTRALAYRKLCTVWAELTRTCFGRRQEREEKDSLQDLRGVIGFQTGRSCFGAVNSRESRNVSRSRAVAPRAYRFTS